MRIGRLALAPALLLTSCIGTLEPGEDEGDGRGASAVGLGSDPDAFFSPGAHRVVRLDRLEQLVVAGVKSIETDLMYSHARGEFYMQHPGGWWGNLWDQCEIEGDSPTFEAFLDRLSSLREHLAQGRPTFIYLDMKDPCLPGNVPGADARARDRFLSGLRSLYQVPVEPLNVIWVSSGTQRWAEDALRHPLIGPHFSLDTSSPCEGDCGNTLYSMDGTGDGPRKALGTESSRTALEPFLGRPAAARDRFPLRFWFSDGTSQGQVQKVLGVAAAARGKSVSHGLDSGRELYLCANEDPARQALWLGATEYGKAPASRQLAYNLRVKQQSGGDSKGAEVAVATEIQDGAQLVVEGHRSEGSGTRLWYSSYRRSLDTGAMQVLRGTSQYDTGRTPDLALVAHEGTLYAFEVHADEGGDHVWYSWFRLDARTGELEQLSHARLGGGKRPRVSLARRGDQAFVVIAAERASGGSLQLELHRLDLRASGALTQLRAPYRYDSGRSPDLAAAWVGDELRVVEAHEAGDSAHSLWTTCHVFDPTGATRQTCAPRLYDTGEHPSVSLVTVSGASQPVLVETHASGDALWYSLTSWDFYRSLSGKIGERAGRQLLHGSYDSGLAPSIALAVTDGGDVVLAEAHSTGSDDLWMDSFGVAPAVRHLLR
jgi:hypothetical protein